MATKIPFEKLRPYRFRRGRGCIHCRDGLHGAHRDLRDSPHDREDAEAREERFQTSVLLAGGMPFWQNPREVDPINFVSRVRTPTLLINGREDLLFSLDTSVRPMYDLFGVAEPDRKVVIVDGGHIPPRLPVIRETLDWLDRYLGPVQAR